MLQTKLLIFENKFMTLENNEFLILDNTVWVSKIKNSFLIVDI